jgi:coenzyme F420-reducing hydrogenase beta subunit
MIQIDKKEDCCGCTACASVCPHNAIKMEPDDLGFVYPKINMELCTDCALCEKVCAFQNGYDTSCNLSIPEVYAVRHKNIRELETSRSGGMFIAISDYILEKGGVVYGVGYKDHFRVAHKRATTKKERNEFKGSKYVQSDLSDIFISVKKDLKDGLYVLFSGTPCQTAGLNEFIHKKYKEKLFLVDIVCHGVPSPNIWRDYLKYTENKYKKKIIKVDFRDKSLGWSTHKESITFEDKRKLVTDIYTDLFYKHIILRPSCGNCKYTNTIRPSDITIADYWGWEKVDPEFNIDNKGCSLVFINSEKGKLIWNNIYSQVNYIPSELSKSMQPNLENPSILSIKSIEFEKNYLQNGFLYVVKKYGNLAWMTKIKYIKQFIKKIIKLIIK